MPQAKTEVALQFSESCAAEVAPQHSLFYSAEQQIYQKLRRNKRKLHCNIGKAALQKSGAFLPLTCRFQAPTFRHPRLGPAERQYRNSLVRVFLLGIAPLSRDMLQKGVSHRGAWGGIAPFWGAPMSVCENPNLKTPQKQQTRQVCEGFIRHRLPDLTLESASPSPPQGSIWHRFNIEFLI